MPARVLAENALASIPVRPRELESIRQSGVFDAEFIPTVRSLFFSGVGPQAGGPWDALRDAHLRLPDWFRHDLDPLCEEYAAQQHRLWRLVAGVDREYSIEVDEKEADWSGVDAVRNPGFYFRRDPDAISGASDHVIAMGMLLKHCGLKAGDWALEYGAGFAQGALALARLGVNVDTVDASPTFCEFVRQQAEFFGVALTPFCGRFGDAPRPERRYDLVWFYESFHHCLDFASVVKRLPGLLAPGGRLILSGEPIVERQNAAVPYPWGLRLHSEVVAVVRQQRWFELGFTEDFLFELFAKAGFVIQRVDCEPSLFGRMYISQHRPAEVRLASQWLPASLETRWGARDVNGRWTGVEAYWPIEECGQPRTIEVVVSNPRWHRSTRVSVTAGSHCTEVVLGPRQTRTVSIVVAAGIGRLVISVSDRWGGFPPRPWTKRGVHAGVQVSVIRDFLGSAAP